MHDLVKRLRQGPTPPTDPDLLDRAADEIEALRSANERFGKRQEWWVEKMFALEEKARADEALHRQALEALENTTSWGFSLPRKAAIAALRKRLGRSGG